MHWGTYEFCAVLSGVIMVWAAVLDKGWKPKDRVWAVAGGVALVIYGFYVAQQTSGTFVFPAAMFAIPIIFAGRALYRLYQETSATGAAPNQSSTRTRPSDAPERITPTRLGGPDADAS